MPGPSQLNITYATAALPAGVTNPIVIPIPAGLVALDSGASGGQGQVSAQTGYSSFDQAVRNIFKAGCFFSPTLQIWFGAAFIQSITAS
jgi:hypothetical protein